MTTDNSDNIQAMRSRLCRVFHRYNSLDMMSQRKKLVLHFDVNKTIVAVDSATGETVEDSLNVYLSGMAWGKENAGHWECAGNELSTHPHDISNVSFYKHEERKFVNQDRKAFRYRLSTFTDKPQGSNFKPYLNMLLQKLAWRGPYDENIHRDMTVPGTRELRYHFILPSFFKLICHLIQENREFAIILRSYGSDTNSVLKCIKAAIQHEMSFCEGMDCLSNTISEGNLLLHRTSGGQFSLTPNTQNGVSGVVKSDEEMYEFMTSCTGITAIKDDVTTWAANHFHPSHGKPVWVDLNDPNTHHVFFDDNIRPGNSDSIVNLRVKRSATETYENVSPEEECLYVNKNLVPVVFPDAIMNENYYIDKLKLCES